MESQLVQNVLRSVATLCITYVLSILFALKKFSKWLVDKDKELSTASNIGFEFRLYFKLQACQYHTLLKVGCGGGGVSSQGPRASLHLEGEGAQEVCRRAWLGNFSLKNKILK